MQHLFSLGRRLAAATLVCLTYTTLPAQPKGVKFGEVKPEDFADPRLQTDPDAKAVIIYNQGSSEFKVLNTGIQASFVQKTRLYFRSEAAFDRWGSIRSGILPFSANFGGFKCALYTVQNGQVIKTDLSKTEAITEKPFKGTKSIRINLPNLSKGCIVEYQYNITFFDALLFVPWQFQYDEPVLYSQYKVIYPEVLLTVGQQMRGTLPLSQVDMTLGNQKYTMENVPAMREEPFVHNMDNFRSSIQFYIQSINNQPVLKNWTEVAGSLINDSDFKSSIRAGEAIKSVVASCTANMTTDKQKADTLFHWIQENVVWNGQYSHLPDPVNGVIKDKKKTDSGTINYILYAMLQEAGIPAEIVLVSTRDNLVVFSNLPVLSQFNHAIVRFSVGGYQYYADAIDPLMMYPLIPPQSINYTGLCLNIPKNTWQILEMAPPGKAKSQIMLAGKIDAEGNITGTFNTRHEGYDTYRQLAFLKDKDQKVWATQQLFDGQSTVTCTDVQIKAPKQAPAALLTQGNYSISGAGQIIADKLYINPLLLHRMEKSPFTLENREFPVEFSEPIDQNYTLILDLPPGAIPVELPKPQQLVMHDGQIRYLYMVVNDGGRITVRSTLQVNRYIFAPHIYPDVKAMYDAIQNLQSQQIVIQLKNS